MTPPKNLTSYRHFCPIFDHFRPNLVKMTSFVQNPLLWAEGPEKLIHLAKPGPRSQDLSLKTTDRATRRALGGPPARLDRPPDQTYLQKEPDSDPRIPQIPQKPHR